MLNLKNDQQAHPGVITTIFFLARVFSRDFIGNWTKSSDNPRQASDYPLIFVQFPLKSPPENTRA